MPAPIVPETLPLDPDFESERGPPIAPAVLTSEGLRRRFLAPVSWQPEQSSDGRLFQPSKALRAAAVLIGLLERGDGLHVVFTVRSSHLNDHAGQISFPGGRIDPADAGPVDAALREAREEICLESKLVEVLGTLPPYLTISGYEVTPVVGLIRPGSELRADPLEVAEFFEVPLTYLMDTGNHRRLVVMQEPARRFLYAIEFQGRRKYLIWGATAAMLRNFYRFLLA